MANRYAVGSAVHRTLVVSAARISARKIAELEQRIGYSFKSHETLVRALTHSSATKASGDVSHYERLEFLGDRVLGLCIAEMLFAAFPKAREGELSVRLNALVSGKMCAEVADEIELHNYIYAGTDVKRLTGKRMQSVRADVTESLIAAIYLDSGLDSAKAFVARFWQQRLHQAGAGTRDSKTALQEWAHARYNTTPSYKIVKRSGPDHDPEFLVEVNIDGVPGSNAKGRSKRAAEQAAAQAILLREKIWIESPDGTIEENDQ